MLSTSKKGRLRHLLYLCMLVCLSLPALAQQPVTGKIVDSLGNPVAGATISDKNTKQTTVSDSSGSFKLTTRSNSVLVISYVGYANKEISVGNQSDLIVTLTSSAASLNEVVVTALGVRREKRNLTYSTQQINGDELTKTRQPSLINAMAGKVAGVQITSSSGNAGASSSIVIRGNTSPTGNNQALFVVDGVPIDNSETSTGAGDAAGVGVSRVIDIDPSTIENINVLKGAAATALYGSAGARGVVLITTKSGGAEKKPVFTLSSDLSYEKPLLPERQATWAQGTQGVYYNGEDKKTSYSWGPRMDTLKINGQPAPKYNPFNFFRTGVTSNSTVSASGGNANSGYFVSYSYYNQLGLMPGNDFIRHSFFAKYNTKMGKIVNTTFQLGYTNSKQDRLPEGASNGPLFILFVQPVSWNPLPVLDSNGNMRSFRAGGRNMAYWTLDNMKNNSVVNRFLPVYTMNIAPARWLTITERLGADIYTEQNVYYENPQPALQLLGKVVDVNSNFRQFNNDIIINTQQTFGKFNVNLLAGNNIYSNYSQNTNLSGYGITIDSFYNVSTGSSIRGRELHYLQRKVGFYAQANIEYNRFIDISLTGRYDGSSVLAAGNQFYPYGSAATSFIFSEFLKGKSRDLISFGKFRLSAASVGNDGVGPYSLLTPYVLANRSGDYPFQGQNGFLLGSTLRNPNLKNERLYEYEAGLEMRFLKDRISFEGSYFYRKTKDGIIPDAPISNATGYSATTINSASIENKGIELLLNTTAVKTKDFNWDLTFNFTKIKNKILTLGPNIPQLGGLIPGQPYNVFYGTRYERTGDGQLLIDTNGYPIQSDTLGIVGHVLPDWLAGMQNTFRYKDFSLSFFFDVKIGGDLQNGVDDYGNFYGTSKGTENRNPFVIKGISEVTGKPNTTPVANVQDYWQNKQLLESIIQDGTYVKLRNITLSYNVRASVLRKTPFKAATLTLSGRNLWIYSPHFTGADPEVSAGGSGNGQGVYSFSTPTARSLNVSVRLSF